MNSADIGLLNEYCQQKQIPLPEYNIINIDGPSHMPMFTMKVIVNDYEFVETGTNKKIAKNKCATKAVQKLNVYQYFKDNVKEDRYRICETSDVDKLSDQLKAIWKEETEDIVLTIKHSNLDEHNFKTIKLRVCK